MPIVILTLEWNEGWHVQISGRNVSSIDMSIHKFVKTRTGPYQQGFGLTGPIAWVMTCAQEPLFSMANGATPQQLPVAQVAEYLEILEEKGYKVVASHSMVMGHHNATHAKSLWTLQRVLPNI